jgi:hypothetical protein
MLDSMNLGSGQYQDSFGPMAQLFKQAPIYSSFTPSRYHKRHSPTVSHHRSDNEVGVYPTFFANTGVTGTLFLHPERSQNLI